MPHGHCYLWKPALVWLHVGSDTLIGLAYVLISVLLYALVRKIRLPFSPMFLAFAAFIGFCGLTHFMEVYTLWTPEYWWSGSVKAVTAVASVATGLLLIPLQPKVLEFANSARLSEERRVKLETANSELESLYSRVKEMDELKSQFFANVSHELRTPLALILGPLESLSASASLTEREKRSVDVAVRNAKTLLKQVNDLLDISRLEAGRMDPHYREVDVVSVVRLVSAHFESVMARRHVRFIIETPEKFIAQIDAEKVERIIMNLLSNAFKFVPEGGTIKCSLVPGQGTFVVRVDDSGPGVHPSQRSIIFERFRQADGSVTRAVGGTGLGLAIVKDFVDLHGGKVGVEDSLFGGAQFTVELPVTAPAGTKVEKGSEAYTVKRTDLIQGAIEQLRPVRIDLVSSEAGADADDRPVVLVCEDNPEMNQFVAQSLAKDFNVITAFDGREGLAKAESLKPDLIISDIMMPNMSGDELVGEVRKRKDLDLTPILLLSAKADDELRIKLLSEGAQDYVMKPFSQQELKARSFNLVKTKRAKEILVKELALQTNDLELLAKESTQRKHELEITVDTMRIAREAAERANVVKSNFLSLVSHELKTPLTTVSINLQMLERLRGKMLPIELERPIERAAASSKALSSLIDSLLEYTRIESGKLTLSAEQIDLAKLIKETAEDFELQAQQKGIEIKVNIPADLGPLTNDTRLIRIVLSNLMMNAVKFTERGLIEVGATEGPGWHRIWVKDTGPGIAEADFDRIFEPFEQLEPIQRKKVPGVGLGLALVKQMLESIGGRIEVQSEVGKGSTFTVMVPPLNEKGKSFGLRA